MKVFISYRRDDRPAIVDRLVDRLMRDLGRDNVFRDIDSFEGADDFPAKLSAALDEADALIAVVGPGWLDAANSAGKRRLEDPNDWVRMELVEALERDDVKVVPLLVDGAVMPKERQLPMGLKDLSTRHALSLPPGDPTDLDLDKLTWQIRRSVREAEAVDATIAQVADLRRQLEDFKLESQRAAEEKEAKLTDLGRRLDDVKGEAAVIPGIVRRLESLESQLQQTLEDRRAEDVRRKRTERACFGVAAGVVLGFVAVHVYNLDQDRVIRGIESETRSNAYIAYRSIDQELRGYRKELADQRVITREVASDVAGLRSIVDVASQRITCKGVRVSDHDGGGLVVIETGDDGLSGMIRMFHGSKPGPSLNLILSARPEGGNIFSYNKKSTYAMKGKPGVQIGQALGPGDEVLGGTIQVDGKTVDTKP